MATLQIPIFSWGADRSKLKQAELRRDQAHVELNFAQRQLLSHLRQFYLEAKTSRSEMDSLASSAELAADSMRLTTMRYQAGESTVLEVVDAQNTLTQARNAYDDGQARLSRRRSKLTDSDRNLLAAMRMQAHRNLNFAEPSRQAACPALARSDLPLHGGSWPADAHVRLLVRQGRQGADGYGASSGRGKNHDSAYDQHAGDSVSAATGCDRAQDQCPGAEVSGEARQPGSRGRTAGRARESRSECRGSGHKAALTIKLQAAYETTTAASLPEEIQKAEADEQQAKQALDAQEKVFESRQQLFDQGALPRKELDQSRVDITAARNQYAIAKKHLDSLMAIGKQQALKSAAGQLESAKGKYLGAQAQLSYSEIRSPIDGVVTDRPLYPGEMAAAGTPLLTVMDISSVIAKAHIPQDDAAALKVGDKGTMTVPGIDEPIEGKVTVVSPALDPNSTTVEVWLEAKNPETCS